MIEARKRLKRVQGHSRSVIWSCAVALTISLTLLPTPSPAATTFSQPIRGVAAETTTLSPIRHAAPRIRVVGVVVSATHCHRFVTARRASGAIASAAWWPNWPTSPMTRRRATGT